MEDKILLTPGKIGVGEQILIEKGQDEDGEIKRALQGFTSSALHTIP